MADGVSNGGRVIRLGAEPAPLTIDPDRAAVLVVDMQNDFASPGGMFDRLGIDVSLIRRVVEPTARVLAAARHAGLKVVYLKMAFRPDLSDLGAPDSPNRVRHLWAGVGDALKAPDGTDGRILIRDTWGTEIVPGLEPRDGETVVYKHRYSGFFETDLDAILKQLGVEYLIVTGCTTSVCVESTVRDAFFRDYSCVVLEDCTAEPVGHGLAVSNHEASLLLIRALFGWVSGSAAFIGALEPASAGAAQERQ